MINNLEESESSILNSSNTDNNKFNKGIIESNIYIIKYKNIEYELKMNLIKDNYIQFKLIQKNNINNYYYFSEYDLPNLNKLLYVFFKNINEIYKFYDKILKQNKIKIIFSKENNNINLNFKNIIKINEEIETYIELKKIKLNNDEMYNNLLNEIIILKNKEKNNEEYIKQKLFNELKNEINEIKEYINIKINEIKNNNNNLDIINLKEKTNKLQEKINNNEIIYNNKINELKKENEKNINNIKKEYELKINELQKNLNILLKEYKKKEEKIFLYSNDNINLINDFKCDNINNLKNINNINNLRSCPFKSIAVYNIERNNEKICEIAYEENNNEYNIIIYNLSLNKITNKINNAHSNEIYKIKHYYQSFSKNHILLTSSLDKSIKLWNISINNILNILTINNCFDGDNQSPFCIMFKNINFFIFGGSRDKKKNIWNENGKLIGPIEKSNLNYGRFIETTYIKNKPYILLSGEYHCECFDYDNNNIKIYKNNNGNNCEHDIINLFNKNNNIYLIDGDYGGNISIFDFISTNLIKTISIGNYICALCSLNEKYLMAGGYNKIIKVIDMDNYSVIKEYSGHNNIIYLIKKINIPNKGEFIISLDTESIKIWK